MPDLGFLLSLGASAVGLVAWAVRVEGRVNGHDKLFEEREKALMERHVELQYRLGRIEGKLDQLNANKQ